MLLFARHHVARAHRTALVTPAFAHANAAEHATRQEAVVISRILKGRRRLRITIRRAEAKILVEPIGIDDLAGIHAAARVPDALEFSKRVDDRLAEHSWQELGARLAVAMLAGQRAAVTDHEIRGIRSEEHTSELQSR